MQRTEEQMLRAKGLLHTNGNMKAARCSALSCTARSDASLAYRISQSQQSSADSRLGDSEAHSLQRSCSCWRRILVPRPWEAFR